LYYTASGIIRPVGVMIPEEFVILVFLAIFTNSGNILRRKIFVNVSKNSDPDVGLRKLQYATRFH